MNTKIVYVLSSDENDLFWEQCLISVMSARHHMPNSTIYLVCDDRTYATLNGLRQQIFSIVNKTIVENFEPSVSKVERSRLMKTRLREIVFGDFLYLDCDTMVIQSLAEIDQESADIAAVLDGHCLFKHHPMRDYFLKQNAGLQYEHDKITQYFNGGVMYAKDSEAAHVFYKQWHSNYLLSVSKGIFIDEPALSKSNLDPCCVKIEELNGSWNCQIRFGALYLANAKVLHFCSKKNMPVSRLSEKNFLKTVKAYGIDTPMLSNYLLDWRSTMECGYVVGVGLDAEFMLSRNYEQARMNFINAGNQQDLYFPHIKTFKDGWRFVRNNILGHIAPVRLAKILYKEKFGIDITEENCSNFNKMLFRLLTESDTSSWTMLADKIAVRDYIAKLNLEDILCQKYAEWKTVSAIDFDTLPEQFVLKCNHDNGSCIVVRDKWSLDMEFIKRFYKKKLNTQFGITTAEPHYKGISPCVFAEEYLAPDKDYSSSVICYKFFAFYGEADYCQVVYDSNSYKTQRSVIYDTNIWEKQIGFINRHEGSLDIPVPTTLEKMRHVVHQLGKTLPFCRIDLYEFHNKVYFSEMTFLPGAGRITSFSDEFLTILGGKLLEMQNSWILKSKKIQM